MSRLRSGTDAHFRGINAYADGTTGTVIHSSVHAAHLHDRRLHPSGIVHVLEQHKIYGNVSWRHSRDGIRGETVGGRCKLRRGCYLLYKQRDWWRAEMEGFSIVRPKPKR